MKKLALVIALAALPGLAFAEGEEMWRWKTDGGTLHYTNIGAKAPAEAELVDSRITLQVDRIPQLRDGRVDDGSGETRGRFSHASAPRGFQPLPDAPRVYDEDRLKFGCYTAGVLWAGGFSHSEDISGVNNCYPYRLGPRAWLNAARAELAMRENGINPRDMMKLYMEEMR